MSIFKFLLGLSTYLILMAAYPEPPSTEAMSISLAIIIAGAVAYSGKE